MHNIPHTQETKDKLSEMHKGRSFSKSTEFKKGNSPWNKGKKLPPLSKEHRAKIKKSMNKPEARKALSDSRKGKFGEKANSWKGGKTKISVIIKEFNIKTTEDGVNCNEIWLVDNGITYCQQCHILNDDYRRRFSKKIKVGEAFQ